MTAAPVVTLYTCNPVSLPATAANVSSCETAICRGNPGPLASSAMHCGPAPLGHGGSAPKHRDSSAATAAIAVCPCLFPRERSLAQALVAQSDGVWCSSDQTPANRACLANAGEGSNSKCREERGLVGNGASPARVKVKRAGGVCNGRHSPPHPPIKGVCIRSAPRPLLPHILCRYQHTP